MRELLNLKEESSVLISIYEVENALTVLDFITKKINFLKDLKKHRNQTLDDEVNKLSEKEDFVRDVILKTMQNLAPQEKTLHFPGTGKATKRTIKPSWSVVDQEKFIAFLKEKNIRTDIIKKKESVDAKDAKQVLEELSLDSVPGVVKTEKNESLTITLEKQPIDQPQLPAMSAKEKVLEKLDISDF